eukprot:c11945_g3_i1.p1 GENE.c11945_g3_i1~~c11945_g3_i1.p1  ORF type:complete len:349 (+),score=51.50 c11945_g3_i1:71-1117(+)
MRDQKNKISFDRVFSSRSKDKGDTIPEETNVRVTVADDDSPALQKFASENALDFSSLTHIRDDPTPRTPSAPVLSLDDKKAHTKRSNHHKHRGSLVHSGSGTSSTHDDDTENKTIDEVELLREAEALAAPLPSPTHSRGDGDELPRANGFNATVTVPNLSDRLASLARPKSSKEPGKISRLSQNGFHTHTQTYSHPVMRSCTHMQTQWLLSSQTISFPSLLLITYADVGQVTWCCVVLFCFGFASFVKAPTLGLGFFPHQFVALFKNKGNTSTRQKKTQSNLHEQTNKKPHTYFVSVCMHVYCICLLDFCSLFQSNLKLASLKRKNQRLRYRLPRNQKKAKSEERYFV